MQIRAQRRSQRCRKACQLLFSVAAAQPLQQMLSGFPRGSVIPLKPLRSTDASLLSEVKRRVQERESGDTKLLPRVKAYSSERREVRNSIRVCCLSNSPKGCS